MARGAANPNFDRRRLLQVLGVGGAAGLAGCIGGDSDDDDSSGNGDDDMGGNGDDDMGGNGDDEREYSDRAYNGGTFRAGTTSTASTMNPLRSDDSTTGDRLFLLYDAGGLTRGVEPGDFGPRWMADWSINDSYDVVTYTIRDGLEWGGDYGALDAETYMYNLEHIYATDPEEDWFGSSRATYFRHGPDNEPIRYEKNGNEIIAELPVPMPEYFHQDTLPGEFLLPKDMLEPYVEAEDDEGLDEEEDINDGTLSQGNLGPYQFVEWERDSRWAYERNEDYYLAEANDWDDDQYANYVNFEESPYFDEYVYQVFDEPSTARSALEAGDVESAGIQASHVDNFRGRDDITLYENPYEVGTFWINLNHRANGWDQIRESAEVRQALAEAYNHDVVIENAYHGFANKTATYYYPWGPFYPSEDDLYVPTGDLDRARDLLESGTSSDYGYDGDTFHGPDGEQVELTAVRTTGSEANEIATNYLQQRLGDLGIDMSIEARQWANLLSNYAQNSHENVDGVSADDLEWGPVGPFNGGPAHQSASVNDWDLMLGLGFTAGPFSPWTSYSSTLVEQGAYNLWGYTTDEYDVEGSINAISTAETREELQSEMTDLLAFLSEDMPMVWTTTDYSTLGYRSDIAGIPGEVQEDGTHLSRGYFDTPDSGRLMSFTEQQ